MTTNPYKALNLVLAGTLAAGSALAAAQVGTPHAKPADESKPNLVFDRLSRLTSVVYPDGHKVDYLYGASGDRTPIREMVTDPTGKATPVTVKSGPFDKAGRPESITNPNGTVRVLKK